MSINLYFEILINNHMIRSSKHSIKFANSGKQKVLSEFIDLYKNVMEFYVNYLWNAKLINDTYVLDIQQGFYNCPKFIDSNVKPIDTKLSGRALKCAATQASAIVRSVLNKRIKDEEKLEWKKSKNIKDQRLEKKLSNPPTKPNLNKIHCDLNSILCSLTEGQNSFDFWLELHSLFNDCRGFKINIPIKNYSRAKMWQEDGKILNGISISKEMITLRYEITNTEKKDSGEIIAIDQGLNSLLTTSRNDEFPIDIHGHTLSSILTEMSKCKIGSKGFQRKSEHRKNYINWLVKQLNLLNVKEIKLENVVNIKFERNVSRLLKHWSNPLIRDSLIKLCEEQGVLVTLVANEFNSQRCNECGWVQKSNRNGKKFHCKNCQHQDDADANATKNIFIRDELFELPFGFRSLKLNLKGFFWNQSGIFSKTGEEITVPQSTQNVEM